MPAESWNEHKNIPKEDPHQNALQREVLGLENLVNKENIEHNRTGADTHQGKPSTLQSYLETHENWDAINKAIASGDTTAMQQFLDRNHLQLQEVNRSVQQISAKLGVATGNVDLDQKNVLTNVMINHNA